MKLQGFVVQFNTHYLTEYNYWHAHKNPADAWVHSKETLQLALEESLAWKHLPTAIIPAVHDTQTRTTRLGAPISVKGLKLEQIIKLAEEHYAKRRFK